MDNVQKNRHTGIKIVCYKSKILANGEHPLMLRITQNKKIKYRSIGISCHPDLWDAKKNKPKKDHPNKDLIIAIIKEKELEYSTALLEFKKEKKDFTPETLILRTEDPQLERRTVFQFFDEIIQRMIISKQVGNANVYKQTKNSFTTFRKGKDLLFNEMTVSMIENYKAWMKGNGNMDTAVSVRLRTLRALFNKAIKENFVKKSDYPFDKISFSDLKLDTRKRAITKQEIEKIKNLNIEPGSTIYEARQYFMFSYYGFGINFIDIAQLKWSDITDNRIYYERSKTGKELNFKLLEYAQEIIEYWKPLTGKNDYVFPILNSNTHITPTQILNRVNKVIGRVNRDLKEIGRKAGIKTPLTTYVARHTSATVLKHNGTATAVISEALGHKSEAVTKTYLKSFDDNIIDDAQSTL
jgi:integrase